MKNKRILVLLLVLVLILALGIGYALSNKNLTISGSSSATASDENFTVRFKKTGSSYDAPTNLSNATASITNDLTAVIDVTGLTKEGDTATATYEIENASNGIDATVTAATISSNTDYFEVTTTGLTSTEKVIASGNSEKITVTVKLIKTPIVNQTGTVTVELTAVPKAK